LLLPPQRHLMRPFDGLANARIHRPGGARLTHRSARVSLPSVFFDQGRFTMTVSSFLPRQAQVLQQLFGYQTEQERDNTEPMRSAVDRFTIALSREAGTPAAEVAHALGERLGWPVYDHELPACIARELHLSVSAVEEIDERGQSWLLECLEAFV